eukprot:scaffold7963_cov116-Isochrysis_galbana.AAC.3
MQQPPPHDGLATYDERDGRREHLADHIFRLHFRRQWDHHLHLVGRLAPAVSIACTRTGVFFGSLKQRLEISLLDRFVLPLDGLLRKMQQIGQRRADGRGAENQENVQHHRGRCLASPLSASQL